MCKERVVITGLGTVNAVSRNIPEFLQALQTGRSGIGQVTVFNASEFRTQTAGQVENWRPADDIPPSLSLKRLSRADTLALSATVQALNQAGCYPVPTGLGDSMGVVIGGGAGGMLEAEALFKKYLNGHRNLPYSVFGAFCCASSADQIATQLDLRGPKTTIMTACSSGATAIGYARDLITTGQAPLMICGGTEALCRVTYGAFNALQAVDPQFCKPFDRHRQGMSLGEAAGILVLESMPHAQARGAKILGEVLGYGLSCDAHHMTTPHPKGTGAAQSMRAALADAGLPPEQVDYINAHGTGTPANDAMETAAIKTVFKDRAYRIPISSTKSMIGHTLSAAGAVEAVATVLAILNDFAPPTIHHTTPDPACDLDYVIHGARPHNIQVALSNSFAFGGNNTSLILGRWNAGAEVTNE